jgi:hypothetical protein
MRLRAAQAPVAVVVETLRPHRRLEAAIEPLSRLTRFAAATRVVDDCIVRFCLVEDGFATAPVPVGSRVELRLMHLLAMRDGRIVREAVLKGWRQLDA